MASDKDLATRLIDAVEDLYLQNVVLMAMMMMYRQHAPSLLEHWPRLLVDLKGDPKQVGNVQRIFAPLRQQIAEDKNLAEVIERFLKVSPPKSDVN